MKLLFPLAIICLLVSVIGCNRDAIDQAQAKLDADAVKPVAVTTTETTKNETTTEDNQMGSEIATFGAGCFWCVEAVFQRLEGVETVRSGYMGGENANPTYEQVCTGTTGHAEVIQIEFDPDKIGFKDLLEVFWKTHDPTTLNQQGADRGTQYRSVVFYHNDEQKELATKYKERLNKEKAFPKPVVTEIAEASELYVAEDYHQNYFNLNQGNPYCRVVIPPKLEKLEAVFGDKLKSEFKP